MLKCTVVPGLSVLILRASSLRPLLSPQEGSCMKRVVLLAILAMALPMTAWADSNLDISNAKGTLAVSAGGFDPVQGGVRGERESWNSKFHDRGIDRFALFRRHLRSGHVYD